MTNKTTAGHKISDRIKIGAAIFILSVSFLCGNVYAAENTGWNVPTPEGVKFSQDGDKYIYSAPGQNVSFKGDISTTANQSISIDAFQALLISNTGLPTYADGKYICTGNLGMINTAGFVFGKTASVEAANVIISTLNIDSNNFFNPVNGEYKFYKDGGNACIINAGKIAARAGGYIVLLSQAIDNRGTIQVASVDAAVGRIVLAAGALKTVALDDKGQISVAIDENMKENIFGADSAIKNSGSILAEGGKVTLTAKVLNKVFDYAINNTGIIEASSLVNHNGVIELVASGAPVLNSGTGSIRASTVNIEVEDSKFINRGILSATSVGDAKTGGYIYIKVSSLLLELGKTISADKLVKIDADTILEVVYAPDGTAIAAAQIDVANAAEAISAPTVQITARKLGLSSSPVYIKSQNLYIRIDGNIDILESVGIGTSVLMRGPPDGFGAIIYPKNTNLTLEAGRITLVGPNPVYFYGNITFSDLECAVPGKQVYFEPGKTYTILGTFYVEGELNGAVGALMALPLPTVGDYRTKATGDWNAATTWQRYDVTGWVDAIAAPTSANANVITILSGHTVTVTADVTIDQTVIDAGGQVTIASGVTLSVANGSGEDLTINGTVSIDGALSYDNTTNSLLTSSVGSGGVINVNSTGTLIVGNRSSLTVNGTIFESSGGNITVTGNSGGNTRGLITVASYGSLTAAGTLDLSLGQLIVNSNGTVTVSGTGKAVNNSLIQIDAGGAFYLLGAMSMGGGSASILNVSGNFIMSDSSAFSVSRGSLIQVELGGTFYLPGTMTMGGDTGCILSVFGNFIMSDSSIFSISDNSLIQIESGGTFYLPGTMTMGGGTNSRLRVYGNFIMSGNGTLSVSTGNDGTPITVYSGGIISMSGTSTISLDKNPDNEMQVKNGGTLIMGPDATIVGIGKFTLDPRATLGIGSTAGIVSGVILEGNIQTTGGRSFNRGANYIYNGVDAQVTGSGLPSLPTKPITGDVTISNPSGVTLTNNLNINGTLTVDSGATLDTGARTITASGDLILEGSITGTGLITLDGASKNISGGGSIDNAVYITGAKTILAGSNLTFNGSVSLGNATADVTNNGTVTASSINGANPGASWTNAAGSTLNYSGATIMTTGTLSANAAGNTVNYNGGVQTVKPVTYYNLTLSGSGEKTMDGGAVSNNLSITDTATLKIPDGISINVGSLTLGGVGRSAGTWGSSDSAATYKNDIYFAASTGILIVANGVPTPTISGVTASQTIIYGTASITLSGIVSAPGPVYPADGEIVWITINGSPQPATISGDAGAFTVNFPTDKIPYSAAPYTITYSYAGGPTLAPAADNTSTTLTVNQRPLTVTAAGENKVYDGKTTATVTLSDDRVPGDTLTADYAGAAFDDENVGIGKPVSVSGITISGPDAGNYTVNDTANTTADIAQKPITVTAVTDTKPYDGTTTSIGVPTITAGNLVGGDTATWTQTFDNANAGTGKTLIPAGVVNDGNAGKNYNVTFVNNTTGVINALPVPVTVTAMDSSIISALSYIDAPRYPLPDEAHLAPYHINLVNPSTGPVYFYHPLTPYDMAAFDAMILDAGAYQFINGSINLIGHAGLMSMFEELKRRAVQ